MGHRYIGSKVRVVDEIIDYLKSSVGEGGRFIDAFSGTGVVASKAADHGWSVHINDMMLNAITLSEARLISKKEAEFSPLGGYESALRMLNNLNGTNGFFHQEYSPASFDRIGFERRYFSEQNAKKIDAIREQIASWDSQGILKEKEKCILLATLICSVNNVANIAGTYGCFISHWTEQSKQDLSLIPLSLREESVNYTVSTQDVFDLRTNEDDVIYFDPPYTKRQYASYYHILETIAVGDNPIVSGVAGLRPWKEKASVFCYKKKALAALANLISKQSARCVLLSYSDDGHIKLEDLEKVLSTTGDVTIHELGVIGRYRPNTSASSNKSTVREFLIDYRHR